MMGPPVWVAASGPVETPPAASPPPSLSAGGPAAGAVPSTRAVHPRSCRSAVLDASVGTPVPPRFVHGAGRPNSPVIHSSARDPVETRVKTHILAPPITRRRHVSCENLGDWRVGCVVYVVCPNRGSF